MLIRELRDSQRLYPSTTPAECGRRRTFSPKRYRDAVIWQLVRLRSGVA